MKGAASLSSVPGPHSRGTVIRADASTNADHVIRVGPATEGQAANSILRE